MLGTLILIAWFCYLNFSRHHSKKQHVALCAHPWKDTINSTRDSFWEGGLISCWMFFCMVWFFKNHIHLLPLKKKIPQNQQDTYGQHNHCGTRPHMDNILKQVLKAFFNIPQRFPLTCIREKMLSGKSAAHIASLLLNCSLWKLSLSLLLCRQISGKRDGWAGLGPGPGPGCSGGHCFSPTQLFWSLCRAAAYGPFPSPTSTSYSMASNPGELRARPFNSSSSSPL